MTVGSMRLVIGVGVTTIMIGGTGVLVGLNAGRTGVCVEVTEITVGVGATTSVSKHPVTAAKDTVKPIIRIK